MTRSNAGVRAVETALMRVYLAVFRRRGPPRPEPAGPRRVLVCKWSSLGDAILSLYALREYKRQHPEAAIEVLVSSRIAEVYRNVPGIEAVHVLPVTGHRLAVELLSPRLWTRLLTLVFHLRRQRFDAMVDLELYRAHGAVLKRLFGIPFSRGFAVEGALDKGHDLQIDRPRHMPEWKCFYHVLGLEPPDRSPAPLYPRAHMAAMPSVSSTLPSAGTGRAGGRPRVGIAFGSSFNWPQKKWPWEQYARAIRLLEDQDYEFILFGTGAEREEAARIRSEAGGRVVDTTGSLDYTGLIREVSACDLVVGNDTGTMHLAAACGVPTLTLFGPTDPRKWNPLTSTAVFLEDLPCRPCYYLGSMPACAHFDCLRKLPPALVAEKIKTFLNGPLP